MALEKELKWKQWSEQHSKSCLEHSRLCDSVKNLLLLQNILQPKNGDEVHEGGEQEHDDKQQKQGSCTRSSSTSSTEAMLQELSKLTVILSNHVESESNEAMMKKLKLPESEEESPFLALRIPTRIHAVKQEQQDGSSSSLLKQLSKLTLTDPKKDQDGDNGGDNDFKYDYAYYNAAAQIIQLEIQRRSSLRTTNPSVAAAAIANEKSNDATTTTSADKAGSGWGLSRRIFQKASSTVTSILASYDLVDDVAGQNHLYHDYDDNDDEVDDALAHDEHMNVDVDNDDAGVAPNSSQNQGKRSCLDSDPNNDSLLTEGDVLYNVELIIYCCRAILSHAKCNIALRKKKYDDGGDGDDCKSEEQITNSSLEQRGAGLFLNRFGDEHDPHSFVSFCHDAGTHCRSLKDEDISINDGNDRNIDKNVGNILRNFQHGCQDLDIILATLLTTDTAQLYCSSTTSCSSTLSGNKSGDIVILYPSQPMAANVNVDSSCPLPATAVKEEKMLGVDVAMFQLSTAIQSHERRMDRFTKQMEQMKQRALASKAAGNTDAALLYMRRLRLCRQEADKCSTVLLNLDQSLMQLKRAKNDAEVVKLYDLVRGAMRDVREEANSATYNAESVMDELAEHSESLQELHELVSDSSYLGGASATLDEDELEKELMEALASDEYTHETTHTKEASTDAPSTVENVPARSNIANDHHEEIEEVEGQGETANCEAILGS